MEGKERISFMKLSNREACNAEGFERKLDARLILSMIAAGIMSFSGVVIETAMNVTFPSLMEEFGIGTSTVQWITTAYLLVLACIMPASSWLKRRFTMKRLFLSAIVLFITGTVLCAISPVFAVLLLGRLIQGVGTGIALPLMFNIILEQAPYDKMGFMMGIGSLITAVAPAVGPSVGGFIVNTLSWRMIFVFLLPLLIISLLLGVRNIRQTSETEQVAFQLRDYLFLAVGFACFIFGIHSASESGWLSVPVITLLVIALLAIAMFCRCSIRSEHPLIRLQVFHCAPFSLSVCVIILIQFICLAMGFVIPNYAQLVMGENSFTAGCLLLPGCILGACLTPIGGKILDRLGAKPPIFVGNASIIASCILFSLLLRNAGILLIIVFYMFFAFGQGLSFGTTMTNGLNSLPANLNSDGNAVINTMQQLSGAVGTCVASTIVASAQSSFSDSAKAMTTGTANGTISVFVLLAILSVITICCSFCVFRGKRVRTASNSNVHA